MFLGKVEPMKTYSSHVFREVGDRFCSIVKCDDDGIIVSRAIHATLGKALSYGRAMCKAANDKAYAVEKAHKAAEKALDNFNYVGSREHY